MIFPTPISQPRNRPSETQLAPLPNFISPAQTIENNNQVGTSLMNICMSCSFPQRHSHTFATTARRPTLAGTNLQFLRFLGYHNQGSNRYSPGGVSSEPLVGAISALLQEIREHHEICKKRDEAAQAMMKQTIEFLGAAVRQITELSKTMAERDDAASARKAAKNVNKTKKAGD
jgi:hypothetical protein